MGSPRSETNIGAGASVGRTEAVELYALGDVRLVGQDGDLTDSLGAKHMALLVYLFHERRPMAPAEIIELLGHGQDEEMELDALQRAVAWLRENVDGVYIKMAGDTIEAISGVWLDTQAVDSAIDGSDAQCVAELFVGDFLANFASGSEEFDEWAQREGARIRRAWTNAILTEASAAEGAGRWKEAQQWWQILVARAPLRAEGVAGLLRSHAMAQDDDAASRAYGEYLARLKQDGGEPAEAVREVVLEYAILEPVLDESVLDEPLADEAAVTPDVAIETSSPEAEERSELEAPDAGEAPDAEPVLAEDAASEIESPAEDNEFEAAEALMADLARQAAAEGPADTPPVETVSGLEGNELPGTEEAHDFDDDALSEAGSPREEPARQGEEWEEIVDLATPDEEVLIDDSFGLADDEAAEPSVEPESAAPVNAESLSTHHELTGHFTDPPTVEKVPEEEQPAAPEEAAPPVSGYVPSSKKRASAKKVRDRKATAKSGGGVGAGLASALAGIALSVGRPIKSLSAGLFSVVGPRRALVGRAMGRAVRYRVAERSAGAGIGSVLRRYWYAPVAAIALLAAVGLTLSGKIGMRADVPDISAPSLPSVSLPKVTVPKVRLKTPGFVTTTVSTLGGLLSGPLLEGSGMWLVAPDVETKDGSSHRALSAALRAGLSQARFFHIPTKEQALLMLDDPSGWDFTLPDALGLAQAKGYAVVLVANIIAPEGAADTVELRAVTSDGEELYVSSSPAADDSELLSALLAVTESVRRKLGEPSDEVDSSLALAQILSGSLEAIDAYDRACAFMFRGRYREAIAAANEAITIDPEFAMAHRLVGEAYMELGQRVDARAALDAAWALSARMTDRERLRSEADRLALQGMFEEAVYAYDLVFSSYRDDVGALKSQAMVQRLIGVRGGGVGNLRVAYSISPVDWPPLSRVARFLGYSGPPLPDVDSLVAALAESG